MAPVGFQLDFYCRSKNRDYRENVIIRVGCLQVNDRSCHSVTETNPTNIGGFKSTFFKEPISLIVQRTKLTSVN